MCSGNRHTPTPYRHKGLSIELGKLGVACRCCCCGCLFCGFRCRRSLAAALGLWRRSRSLADELGGHDARDKELRAMVVKIHSCPFPVRGRYDAQAVHQMLDRLTFLHYLHNVLLDHAHPGKFSCESFERNPSGCRHPQLGLYSILAA
jgi:hypothetical protein